MDVNMERKKLKRTTIGIPLPLYDRLKSRARKTGFTSESDYATYLLREAVNGLDEEDAKKNRIPSKEASRVFEKLKSLGYI